MRTDMTKLLLAFLNFANAPKSYVDRRTLGKYGVTGNARNPQICVDETFVWSVFPKLECTCRVINETQIISTLYVEEPDNYFVEITKDLVLKRRNRKPVIAVEYQPRLQKCLVL